MDTYKMSDFAYIDGKYVLIKGDAMLTCTVFADSNKKFAFMGKEFFAIRSTGDAMSNAALFEFSGGEKPVATDFKINYVAFCKTSVRMTTTEGGDKHSLDPERLGECSAEFSASPGIRSVVLDPWQSSPHLMLIESISVAWIEGTTRGAEASRWVAGRKSKSA